MPPRQTPEREWRVDLRGTVFRMVATDATVYCLTLRSGGSGDVYAVRTDGVIRWHEADLDGVGSLDYVAGRLYLGGRTFRALEADSGGELFETKLPDGQAYSAVEHRGTIYVATNTDSFYGLDADTGAIQWHASIGGDHGVSIYRGQPLVSSPYRIRCYRSDRSPLTALLGEPPAIHTSWQPPHQSVAVLWPAVVDGTLYRGAVGTDRSTVPLIAYDLDAGRRRWHRELASYVYTPAVDPDAGRVYTFARPAGARTSHGTVYALDSASGATAWSQPLDFRAGCPVIANETVYLSGPDDDGGRVVALDSSTGAVRWEAGVGDSQVNHALLSVGERLYVGGTGEMVALA
ncbi:MULTISPECIES: outer membrane protein assembly factor BamB family protein [Halomicrobium]|uniref:Pyrrolo-quinoline quinone n=1 Tax=Halomicrobium mukohataei TaxID=57705 RepID=A0A4D6KK89_9EURY|nr:MULTISPECIES: PQQ-binding-like beta-propeller repeat protein [Halomicrobium]QCD66073.1 pyrrolo-quinoline quinone [Halomicrobium mukohataei]QFR20878.1 PQQ-binding-like beta-propeller repeat protein [Halomicrobium sp. ZPS1]